MQRFCILFIVLLLMNPATCSACSQSIYHITWSKDGWILGGSATIAIAASLVEDSRHPMNIQEICRLSRESINWFDRSATYKFSEQISEASDFLVGVIVVAPFALLIDTSVRDDWRSCTLMYLETMMLAASLPSYAKGGVERIRPFVYNPDAPMDRKMALDPRGSFFSRHTTLAFASAVFLSTVWSNYHPRSHLKRYVWAGSLVAATAVGFMRCESGQHFPSDVITGAGIGSVIGYVIPLLHRVGDEKISVLPYSTNSQLGVTLCVKM